MPYTPPSHQSPASSKTASPAVSRSASFSLDSPGTWSPASPRASLPRSVSSTTYLNKQRRGPTVSHAEATGLPQSPVEDDSSARNAGRADGAASNNGAILSPPDSSENSDGEDVREAPRGRHMANPWGDLQQAVRSIELRRESSPVNRKHITASEPTTTIHSPSALSVSARKITHSRSSTSTAIISPDRAVSGSPSDSDSDDGDELRVKPPLLRKKSGELVKPALRPSSRRRYSSMPGTPTYGKSVHFNDNGNQTRHFLQVDKPSAVSAGSSPVETYDSDVEYPFEGKEAKVEWTLRLANFPESNYERESMPVRVERLYLSSDTKTLIGTVAVANIAFQKNVAARFTLDYWKTTSEVAAEFDHDVRRQNPADGCDRFCFNIRLSDQAHLENKTLLLCVRYNAGGQEHWDSNNGANYQIDFVKKLAKSASTSSLALPTSGSRTRNTIPRSRHSPPTTRSSERNTDDLIRKGSTYHFGSPEKLSVDTAQTSVKLKPRSKRAELPRAGVAPSTNGLGGRYDFGASLSAALSTAQDKLGKQSGLLPHPPTSRPQAQSHYFSPRAATEASIPVPEERPDSISTDRPAIGSQQYRDLVNKFCYFTPGTSGKTSPPSTRPANTDGSSESTSPSESSPQSGSTTPTPQNMSPFFDGANDKRASANDISTMISGSGSPANGYGARAYAYPYHQNIREAFFPETLAPTAIHG